MRNARTVALVLLLAVRALGGSQYARAMQLVGYPVIALGFGALVVAATTALPTSALGRLCGSRTLRWAGRHSYALYLFHPLVQSAVGQWGGGGRTFGSRALAASVVLPLTAALAYSSWRWLEFPMLGLKRRLAP